MDGQLSRRTLLRGAAGAALIGASGGLLAGCGSNDSRTVARSASGVEAPPETTTIRVASVAPGTCYAAQYAAEPFLREEGFTDVQYVKAIPPTVISSLAQHEFDVTLGFVGPMSVRIDAGDQLVMLGGAHVGCWRFYAQKPIHTLRDLKGKTIATVGTVPTSPGYSFASMTLANVGIDPRKDVTFVDLPRTELVPQFLAKKDDAFIALPPIPDESKAAKAGHVLVDSMQDRPWVQYYCCMATTTRDFMQRNPVATKRMLRAILKGADMVHHDPAGMARMMVDKGFTPDYGDTLKNLHDIPYNVWRDYDPADSVRHYTLLLNEAGFISSTPEQILAKGTDFSFLTDIRKGMV